MAASAQWSIYGASRRAHNQARLGSLVDRRNSSCNIVLTIVNVRPVTYMKHRRRPPKGSLTELQLALVILFLLVSFPLIDLLGLATGCGTAALIAHQAATRAAATTRYDSALSAVRNEANNLLSSGFAAFAHMTPKGGFRNCGVDLYVIESNYRSGGNKSYGPNTPVSGTIDPSTCFYECNTRACYQIGPTISLNAVPWIDQIPGLGRPATITFSANRAAEYPLGLTNVGEVAVRQNDTLSSVNIPWDSSGNASGSSWNYPNVYQIIKQTYGVTPYDDDVIVVQADNPRWVTTHFIVKPGDHIFSVVRNDGAWSLSGVSSPTVAGYPPGWYPATGDPDPAFKEPNGLQAGELVFVLGPLDHQPPPPYAMSGGTIQSNGTAVDKKIVLAQSACWNVIAGQEARLYFIMNDGPNGPKPNKRTPYIGNQGCQIVRVVVAH